MFLRYYSHLLLFLYVLLQVTAVVAQADIISDIQFAGNRVTRDKILRQELTIKVGDPLDQEQLQASRQSIMDLGLFKSVDVEVSESGVVVVTVKEKSFVLFLPRFSRDSESNKVTPGARLGIYNLAGTNQRLELTYIRSQPDDVDHGNQHELGLEYNYPKIFAGNYSLGVSANIVQAPLQYLQAGVAVAEYERDDLNVSMLLSRWLKKTAPSSGWTLGIGVHFQKHDYSYISGLNNVFADDHAVSLLGELSYSDIHDHLYSRSGMQYGYRLEQGLESLGSDYQFNRHLLYYRHFIPLHRPHHNLNVQLRLGFSAGHTSNLGEDAYTIDGYGDLRGYSTEVSGDAFALLNLEYLRPVLGWNHVRSLLFVDVGNAYANNGDVDFSGLKWTAGTGVRWRIKKFVNLDLSMEYAYDVDNKKDKVYFKTSGSF